MTLDETLQEKDNIAELRMRLKGQMSTELYDDDNMFQRFLRARNQNINAAEVMLKKHLSWRRSFKFDTIAEDYTPPEVFKKYLSFDLLGHNSDGSPVVYSLFGNMDTRGILRSATSSEACRYVAWMLNNLEKSMKDQTLKREHTVDQLIVIMDFENLSLANATHKPTIEAMISILQMYDSNFPERLKAAYVVNASAYFMMGWIIVRPFLTGRTFQKIQIFGKNNWQNVLLRNIDPECIPAIIVGKLTDPDGNPKCETIIKYAGPVPESYYRKTTADPRLLNASKLHVQRMSKAEVKVMVPYPGSIVEWEIDLKDKDIGFSLVLKKGDGESEVVQKQRIQTVTVPESGIYQCEEPGTYYLQFDNTYSWLHNKEIHYRVSVTKPRKETSSF